MANANDLREEPVDASPGKPPKVASTRSQLVRELRELPPRQRRDLGLDDSLLEMVDVLLTVALVLVESDDLSAVSACLDEEFSRISPASDAEAGTSDPTEKHLEDLQKRLQDSIDRGQLRWIKSVTSNNHWTRFLAKLLGAARFERLKLALKSDSAALIAGLGRISSHLEPFAVAFDDMITILPDKDRESISQISPRLVESSLQLIVHFGAAMDRLVASDFDFKQLEADLKVSPSVASDLAETIVQCRAMLANPLQVKLGEFNQGLVRKISGARFALENSVDGVSQASNSIIELLDRILRQAFTDAYVLGWLQSTGKSGSRYTYERSTGGVLPTKYAQALCLVHGGIIPEQSSLVHDAAAQSLVTARAELQKLKHADNGSPEEVEKLRKCFSAVEGCLTLVVRLAWSALPDETVDDIRGRLAA